jgi:hypothetical protein
MIVPTNHIGMDSPSTKRPDDHWFTWVVVVFLCFALLFIGWAAVQGLASGSLGLPARNRPVVMTTPEAITGSVLLVSDGVTILYTDPDGMCRDPRLTVTESATQVALSLTVSYVRLFDCSYGPPQPSPTTSATLAHPLGTRALVDARTGKAVPYFDQRRELFLNSTTLPFMWTQDTNPPYADASTEEPFFGGPGAAVLVETYLGIQRTAAGNILYSHIQIVQVTGGGWQPPPGTVTTPVLVRGRAGLAASGIVVWTESDMTVAVIGYGPQANAAWSMTENSSPLPIVQLVDIANHLYRGAL